MLGVVSRTSAAAPSERVHADNRPPAAILRRPARRNARNGRGEKAAGELASRDRRPAMLAGDQLEPAHLEGHHARGAHALKTGHLQRGQPTLSVNHAGDPGHQHVILRRAAGQKRDVAGEHLRAGQGVLQRRHLHAGNGPIGRAVGANGVVPLFDAVVLQGDFAQPRVAPLDPADKILHLGVRDGLAGQAFSHGVDINGQSLIHAILPRRCGDSLWVVAARSFVGLKRSARRPLWSAEPLASSHGAARVPRYNGAISSGGGSGGRTGLIGGPSHARRRLLWKREAGFDRTLQTRKPRSPI